MRTLLVDLEGTLYTRDGVLPGAVEAVAALRERADALRFLTNTDSQDDETLLAGLGERGFDITSHELFTPVTAAAALLAGTPDARAFVLATEAVRRQLGRGLVLTGEVDEATHVVVGDCRPSLSYDLLNAAFGALDRGAALVALQRGRFFLSQGRRQLDTGAVVAALEYAAGIKAEVVGKPAVSFVRLALASVGAAADGGEVWVVGDDATSDIAMGRAAGVVTVQVRTGKYAHHCAGDATHVVDSIADVPALLG